MEADGVFPESDQDDRRELAGSAARSSLHQLEPRSGDKASLEPDCGGL